jgi:hypothetical protein
MKFIKEKISPTATIYYVQKPDQRLVQLVNSQFDLKMGNLAEQNIKMIRKTSDMPREIYTLKFHQDVYYIKKYYPFTLKQRIKYFKLMLVRIKNFMTPRIPLIRSMTSQPLFVLKKRKNLLSYEIITVMNRRKDASY